ncbi:DUF6318 family protein [Arthrobacter sp. SDTb3-6]|uniref:DUF6318 family protein n=1 Tax=Arthrobacter sp. SDTb3-6 TaxID=2713571 RepID=UPI00159E5853|nr:hypothetical protein [Arthrobacter sp. SDTb3-6]
MALTAVLALAGCGTDSQPNRAPSPATAPPTSAAPATTAAPTTPPIPVYQPATANGPAQNVPVPVLPAKAKEFSKAGLEAFATYWYSTLGYVYETGDSKPMMEVTDANCGTCKNINDPVGKWYQPGGWIVGGRMTVHSTTTSFVKAPDGMYQVVLMTQQSPPSFYNPDKSLRTANPASPAQADILMAAYKNGRWTAYTIEKLTGPAS